LDINNFVYTFAFIMRNKKAKAIRKVAKKMNGDKMPNSRVLRHLKRFYRFASIKSFAI